MKYACQLQTYRNCDYTHTSEVKIFASIIGTSVKYRIESVLFPCVTVQYHVFGVSHLCIQSPKLFLKPIALYRCPKTIGGISQSPSKNNCFDTNN